MRKDWRKVRLGEVLRQRTPDSSVEPTEAYQFAGVYSFGRGVFRGQERRGSEFAYQNLTRLRQGEFVYPKLMAWEGAFGIVPADCDGCYVSPEFPVFEIDTDRLAPPFLGSYFKIPGVWKSISGGSTGTNVRRRRLNPAELLQREISLPPLVEQQRVVARIEELAAQIHEARTLRDQAAEEAAALYPQQLGEAMTPHGEAWKRETVADVIRSLDAGWSPQCDDIPAQGGEWGVLKTTAVQWCEFQPHHNKALPPTLAPIPELAVKEGDVLVTRAGPRKRVAVVAAVRRDEPRLTISDKLIRLRTDRTKIEPRFLELSLASPFSQEHLVRRKTGLADAQVNISQSILRATPVAYPPLPEQRRIVAELDALQAEVDALKRLQAETATEIDALLPAVLDRAFKGEL